MLEFARKNRVVIDWETGVLSGQRISPTAFCKGIAMSQLLPSSTPAADWHIDSIAWQEVAPDGTRYSLLEGVRDQAGVAFSYAFFIPAGFWDPAHWHTADARVFVAKGTLYLGYGDVMDKAKAKAFPAGSYVVVPANMRHFDGSDEDTLILGMAIGPWSTLYVDPSHQSSAGTPAS
jgi:quercetin dioxygenase-like cupin family protein